MSLPTLPFSLDVLQSSFPLSPFQTDVVQASPQSVLQERHAISERIRTLQEAYEGLAIIIGPLESALAPVRRLPGELLTEIFRWTADSSSVTATRAFHPLFVNVRARQQMVLKLGHICRYWRKMAQDDALLWSFVYISETCRPLQQTFLELCLSRSRNSQLDVFIDLTHWWPGEAVVKAQDLACAMLVAHSGRWRSCTIMISSTRRLPACLATLTDTPVLCTADIRAQRTEDLPSFLRKAPKLRDLAVHTTQSISPSLRDGTSLALVLPSLRSAKLDGFISSSDALCLLETCPHLEELDISLPAVPGQVRPMLKHNGLKHLRTDGDFQPLIEHLTAPRLKSFEAYFECPPGEGRFPFSFTNRSPQLETVTIQGFECTTTEESCPFIHTLQLSLAYWDTSFDFCMDCLLEIPSQTISPFPNVRTLVLDFALEQAEDVARVIEIALLLASHSKSGPYAQCSTFDSLEEVALQVELYQSSANAVNSLLLLKEGGLPPGLRLERLEVVESKNE